MKLLRHQEEFSMTLDRNSILLCWETGIGKTIAACLWLKHNGRDRDALVICPKRVKEKWRETLMAWKVRPALIVSMEEFKKLTPRQYTGVVVDEADEFASSLFKRTRSQRATCLYNQVRKYPAPIILLTATPIRSSPDNLHSLLCYMGIYIDYKKWRERFYSLQSRPYLPRPAWIPNGDWRIMIRNTLKRYADIVLLKDIVDELPPVTHTVIKVIKDKYKQTDELEPRAAFVAEHIHEQKNKPKEILAIAKGYRKVLVVAYYREQIEALREVLGRDRTTYTVYGGIKDQESILKKANDDDECFLIVQASLAAGFDADSFSCVIFASMSYAVRDYVQMKGRVRRIHNLHSVVYYYLIAGDCDKAVKKNVDLGKDFIPSEFYGLTGTTKKAQ